jgi:hypothetical protein
MAIIEITVQFRKEDKHTSQTQTLDGVRFQLETYTNRADNSWYMNILDTEGNALVVGIALATGLDLLYPYRHLDVPAGVLFVNDLDGPRTDPGLDSFIDREAALYYQDAEGAAA